MNLDLFYETLVNDVKYFEGNLIDVLSSHRGWNPLTVGETMTITVYQGACKKRYVIVRLEDDE